MLTQHSLSLAESRRMIEAGERCAERLDSPSNLAVVDAGGHLIAHVRMDGAQLGSIHHAINKAFTSVMLKGATADLRRAAEPGGSLYGLDGTVEGRIITFAGGVPVEVDGEIVGAVGVSGGSAEQDQQVAEATVAGLATG